ncbi:hypothetical protein HGRIS_008115 [Hohenbuehelia grisea]|uniref:Pheromone-regulated membrane protein 10 n=1 Tax=Hohenbuehelia grisea TaxID=104357 RepID=A0ABR3J713_9AGAR
MDNGIRSDASWSHLFENNSAQTSRRSSAASLIGDEHGDGTSGGLHGDPVAGVVGDGASLEEHTVAPPGLYLDSGAVPRRPLSRIQEEMKNAASFHDDTQGGSALTPQNSDEHAQKSGQGEEAPSATLDKPSGDSEAENKHRSRRRSIFSMAAFVMPERQPSAIVENAEVVDKRRKFILKLAYALLKYGAPSHRIESQLKAAAKILKTETEFVHLPNIIIVTIRNGDTKSSRTHFVRARGRVALTSLQRVHEVYRDVLHDQISASAGTAALKQLLREPPLYPLAVRCGLSFLCGVVICALSFGGSILDMWVSGLCASLLQYLGLNAANKSASYANVYEISVTIFVAFVARGLSSIPGHLFCYSAISSAGVVVILPGFTILISALELMSRNLFCGSVRIVYAIIYTLFLGFGLTIGSDFYLLIDRRAHRSYQRDSSNRAYVHGHFSMINGTTPASLISGVLAIDQQLPKGAHIFKGCIRDPTWSWYKQAFPWWTVFFMVPIYTTCSSLSNLQSYKSIQLPIMVFFSCCSYAANKATSYAIPGRSDVASAAGAFAIGMLGNLYSRLIGGTAFTSMVSGVLLLVPSAIAQGGGLTQNYHTSSQQYSSGFSLAIRMISVAAGVTIGLFVSQVLVYTLGRKKRAAHFAF